MSYKPPCARLRLINAQASQDLETAASQVQDSVAVISEPKQDLKPKFRGKKKGEDLMSYKPPCARLRLINAQASQDLETASQGLIPKAEPVPEPPKHHHKNHFEGISKQIEPEPMVILEEPEPVVEVQTPEPELIVELVVPPPPMILELPKPEPVVSDKAPEKKKSKKSKKA